jgi:CHAT domain-containing protein
MKPLGPDSFEERNFLGLEFKIGRWHISQSSLQSERPPQRVRFQELVAIAPQYQGKQTLSAQAQELKVLEAIDGYRRVSGRLDGIKALFGKFPRGIIHFAGHGIIRCSEQGVTDYLILLEDAELDVLAWKGLIHGKREQSPFFFFNACDAGKAEQIANFVDGWAPAVLEAGACGYVGALWPLNDKGAAEFATHFYHAMTEKPETNPADVAEILRETRSLFLENGDPTFLAYIFYGDPYLKLVRY